jgi:polyferredoxin
LGFIVISLIPEINFAIVKKRKHLKTELQEAILPVTLYTDIIINKNFKNMFENFNSLPIVNSIFYSFLGIIILLIAYVILEKLTPEKTWQEIVKNQNIALAIVFGAFILGIAMIISSAIRG